LLHYGREEKTNFIKKYLENLLNMAYIKSNRTPRTSPLKRDVSQGRRFLCYR
jgi:hypothetical protein